MLALDVVDHKFSDWQHLDFWPKSKTYIWVAIIWMLLSDHIKGDFWTQCYQNGLYLLLLLKTKKNKNKNKKWAPFTTRPLIFLLRNRVLETRFPCKCHVALLPHQSWSKLQTEPYRLDFEDQNRVFKTRVAINKICF